MMLTALTLAGCANLERHQSNPVSQMDDDTYCQSHGGPQGSAAYVACRKDRDVAATRAGAREARTYTAGNVPGSSAAGAACHTLSPLTKGQNDEKVALPRSVGIG